MLKIHVKKLFFPILLLLAAFCAFFLLRNGKQARGTGKNAEAPSIVCITYPVWLIARDLMHTAPENAPRLSLLVPPDTGCPHDYALTPGELLNLSRAKRLLLLRNGAGLDDALYRAALKANPSLESADASAGFRPRNATDPATMDSHIFTSPSAVQVMARNLTEALCKFDPANAELYAKNEADFLKRLPELPPEWRSGKQYKILAMHGSFAHLLDELGFVRAGVVVSGHSFDLSPAEIRRLINTIRRDKIRFLISEPQAPARIAQTLKEETGIRVLMLDPAASGPEDPPLFYLCDVIRNNIRLLLNAAETTSELPAEQQKERAPAL